MSYFIRINDATDVRRRTLESSKELLHVLRGYQRVLLVRERKKQVTEQLRRTLGELSVVAARLEDILPAKSLKGYEEFLPKKAPQKKKEAKKPAPKAEPEPKKEEQKPEQKPEPKPKVEKQKPLTELERLEQALSSIEKRLETL